jgi:tetratricopeptide (TPR) repeat protein
MRLALILVAALVAPAAAQPGGGPDADRPAPTRVPKKPLTAKEKEILAEVERDFERYQAAANAHHQRTQLILSREYNSRKRQLEKRYASRLAAAERDRQARQLDAMRLMEKFIADHPAHKRFTPDVMFRLADLYLDEANYLYDQQFALDTSGNPPPPAGDEDLDYDGADYSKALGTWRQILDKFPEYRQRDGATYLLAYYLNQMNRDREALAVARGLVCANKFNPLDPAPEAPPETAVQRRLTSSYRRAFVSPYGGCTQIGDNKLLAQDAWVRIVGDVHFNTPGELGEAIAAYEKVARNVKSTLYDEALYKLAWSFYRNDEFVKGIEAFDEAIRHSDRLVAQGKPPLDLRPEALQYIAISFTDPWSSDELADPQRGFDRAWSFYKSRLKQGHVRDVFVQLGDTFELVEAWDQAVDSYRVALKYWPLHATNPVVHQKVVAALQSKGDTSAADEEAARLALLYAPGTEWYTANETDRRAMSAYATIGQRMLRAAAENVHKSAQGMRAEYAKNETPENKLRYIAQYRKAAALYKRFIDEYPTADEVYEFTYRLGETSFFAGRYMEAIGHYRWVRDHKDLSSARFQQAAFSIIKSYEAEIERRVADGELAVVPDPTMDQLKAAPRPIKPRRIPALLVEYRDALDQYQNLVNDPSTAPAMGLDAGMVSYRYLDLADAEKRFAKTFDKFCGTPEAVQAKDNLLAIYEATDQDAKFAATNKRFINSKCGTADDIALARAQIRSKSFREAEDVFNSKEYPRAAIDFYRYYKTAPRDDPNLPVALYNSAVAYDRSGKPKTAVYLFKEFTNNPDAAYRDSEYYLPALYLTAVSHYKAFDYKLAVDVYLEVVEVASQKGRKPPAGDRSAEQIRLDALYNAALLRELDRVYYDPRNQPGTGAASLYERYAREEQDRRKADRAMWAVARVWRLAGDANKLRKAYDDWRKRYGRDAGNADDYIFSYYDMAKQYAKKGKKRDAQRMRAATLQAWSDVGRPRRSPGATMAAEFEFAEADEAKAPFDRYKIRRAPRTKREAERALDRLDQLANDAVTRFQGLAKYESAIWSLAARVRIGDVRFFQALKIAEIPAPRELIRLDEKYPDKEILIRYQDALDTKVKPLEQQARLQWERVTELGKQQGVSNEWTRLAQERLHDFISQTEFPVLREEMREGTSTP